MGKLMNMENKPQVMHFSHEHPLERFSNATPTNNTTCFGCGISVTSGMDFYACRTCGFTLHRLCYDLPRKIQHPGHQNHDLFLLPKPTNANGTFDCIACARRGSGFFYNCHVCGLDYHVLCLVMPLSLTHQSHPHHPLQLEFSPPYVGEKGFRCDVCSNPGSNHWLYRCNGCQYDVHLSCATSNQRSESQPQYQSRSPIEAPTMPAGYNMNTTGFYTGAPQFNPSASYANQQSNYANNVVQQPNGNYLNQAGMYGSNQAAVVRPNGMMMGVPQVNQGFGYANQPAFGSNQMSMGNGMTGLLVGGAAAGMGQAVGEEVIRGVIGGFGGDRSGSSNQSVESNIMSGWVGSSDF